MANEYVNELEINGQKRLDLTQDTATPETVLEGETFHLRSGAPATGTYRPSDEIEARLRATVGHSSKNLLSLDDVTSATINGVTWTVNAQTGTITASGTTPSNRESQFAIPLKKNEAGNYYLSGCPATGSSSTYNAFVWDATSNARPKQWDGTTNAVNNYDATPKQFKSVDEHTYEVRLRIWMGQTVNNLVFKPMVWDGSISDNTFEPHQEPTDSLIETKARAYLNSTVGHACKNLYQITADTQNINGVTYTVDKTAGTITANGTSPSNAEASLKQSFVVTPQMAGEKLFSVSLNQVGSSTKFDAYLYDQTDHKFVAKWDGSTRSPAIYGTESQEVLLIEGHTVEYTCRIFKNQTVSNLIYKPMLREASIADDTFEPYQIPTDELIARLDQRIYELERINEKPTADPDEGEYFITVFNNFGSDCDIWLSTPFADDGEFYDKDKAGGSHWVGAYHRPLNYYGKPLMVLFRAGTGDIVMTLNNSQSGQGRFYKEFDVDEFLDMCDVKDGSATNYISIHLCDDGGIRNQVEYEAYIGS